MLHLLLLTYIFDIVIFDAFRYLSLLKNIITPAIIIDIYISCRAEYFSATAMRVANFLKYNGQEHGLQTATPPPQIEAIIGTSDF